MTGFGLVNHILEKHENAFVYAATRDPENATVLRKLSSKYPGRISIVKCDYRDTEGIARMAKQIKEGHGRVDTVIANAGVCLLEMRTTDVCLKFKYVLWLPSGVAGAFGLVHEIPVEETLKSFEVDFTLFSHNPKMLNDFSKRLIQSVLLSYSKKYTAS